MVLSRAVVQIVYKHVHAASQCFHLYNEHALCRLSSTFILIQTAVTRASYLRTIFGPPLIR